jgi:hypothetical protein
LRNIRSTLVISLAIPISIIATFALIYFGGFTLNLMTLGGLALGVGMMVDSSCSAPARRASDRAVGAAGESSGRPSRTGGARRESGPRRPGASDGEWSAARGCDRRARGGPPGGNGGATCSRSRDELLAWVRSRLVPRAGQPELGG